MEDKNCRVKGYLAQWGRLHYLAMYTVTAVLTRHHWSESFLGRSQQLRKLLPMESIVTCSWLS